MTCLSNKQRRAALLQLETAAAWKEAEDLSIAAAAAASASSGGLSGGGLAGLEMMIGGGGCAVDTSSSSDEALSTKGVPSSSSMPNLESFLTAFYCGNAWMAHQNDPSMESKTLQSIMNVKLSKKGFNTAQRAGIVI